MKRIFFIFIALQMALPAQSTRDSIRTFLIPDNVVVTANRYETSLNTIGNSISIIPASKIEQGAAVSLYSLLKSETGLHFYQSGGYGQLATNTIRGGGSGHSLVLLDGVKLNMPNELTNTVDFAVFPLESVERIEILKGPQSTLYGSDAVSGVINIISKEAVSPFSAKYRLEAGSFNSMMNTLSLSGRLPDVSYTILIDRFSTKGISSAAESDGNTERDGAGHFVAEGGLRYNPLTNLLITFRGRYKDAAADLDQFGGIGGDDPTYTSKSEETLYNLKTEYKIAALPVTLTGMASFIRNLRKYEFNQLAQFGGLSHSRYDGFREKYSLQAVILFGEKEITTAGLELERESALSYYLYFSSFYSTISDLPRKSMRAVSFFAQHQTNPIPNLFITAGTRKDTYDKFGSETTFRISPAYVIEPLMLKLKGAIGNSFKAPSLFSLYDPSFGNETLKPERSISREAGFEFGGEGKGWTAGATYFQTSSTNLFGFDAATFKTININEVSASGIEANASFRMEQAFEAEASYTFLETKNKSGDAVDAGRPLVRRPKHKGALAFTLFPLEGVSLNLQGLYCGERYDKVFDFILGPGYKRMADYFLVNAAVTFRISSLLEFYTRAENLLDRKYQDMLGYGTPGAAIYFGFRLRYQ